MTEHKSHPEVMELEDTGLSADADKEKFRKYLVRGPDGPWDAMNAAGVPEAGEAYGPDHPRLTVAGRSARAVNGNPDDCCEWEVTVRYSDRGESEDRIRRGGRFR